MINMLSKFKMFHKGQSLVETALILPLVLVMVIGVVEIGQFLVTTNRIRTVANTSARFTANGGQDEGIPVVALNTITQTLPFNTQYWDMWAIRGEVNEEGTGFETWQFTHVYGDQITQKFEEVDEATIQLEVLNDLKTQVGGSADDGVQEAKGVEFAGTLILYDAQSILGLEYFFGDLFTVQALNVMRTYPVNPTTNGCTGFPIAIQEGIRSVTSETYPTNFNYPDEPPSLDDFPANVPNVPFLQAQPGYIYKIFNGAGAGNFGWLKWNKYINGNNGDLMGSLTWPGNSDDYTTDVNGSQTPPGINPVTQEPYTHGVYGFIDATDDTDTEMHINDWVSGNTGVSSAAWDALDPHIDRGRALRLIVWGSETQDTGTNTIYKITRFAVMRLHGYRSNEGQGGSWILAEFVSWDDSCGQVSQ